MVFLSIKYSRFIRNYTFYPIILMVLVCVYNLNISTNDETIENPENDLIDRPEVKRNIIDIHESIPGDESSQSAKEPPVIPKPGLTFAEARPLLEGYKYEDIMAMKPIRYLDNFKNPCWLGTDDNGPINDNKIHCLPYFYLIGVKKSGTCDLFYRISQHPEVTTEFKEAQWFPHRRFLKLTNPLKSGIQEQGSSKDPLKDYDPREFNYYVRMFDTSAAKIVSSSNGTAGKSTQLVTGEGTPDNLHIQGIWDLLPGNEGLLEPRYTNLDFIKHLIPQVKIIVSFRDPVERLYSDWMMHSKIKDRNLFHQHATDMVDVYSNCFKRQSFRSCIYNHSFNDVFPMTFAPAVGFYAFFMKELRSVFTEEQMLVIFFDDYIANPTGILGNIYDFLKLSRLDSSALKRITYSGIRNSGRSNKAKAGGEMLDKTMKMLKEFYRSSNEEMAELMNDDRFLFSEDK